MSTAFKNQLSFFTLCLTRFLHTKPFLYRKKNSKSPLENVFDAQATTPPPTQTKRTSNKSPKYHFDKDGNLITGINNLYFRVIVTLQTAFFSAVLFACPVTVVLDYRG